MYSVREILESSPDDVVKISFGPVQILYYKRIVEHENGRNVSRLTSTANKYNFYRPHTIKLNIEAPASFPRPVFTLLKRLKGTVYSARRMIIVRIKNATF